MIVVFLLFFNLFCETIDGMENVSKWSVENSSGTTIYLSSTEGFSGEAIEMNYDLGESSISWVQMRKDIYLDLSKGNAIKFYYKGDGSENYLEFKITDFNGDVFGIQNFNVTNLSQWQEVLLSFDEDRSYPVKYLWNDFSFGEGDKILDRDKIKKVEFTISKKDGGSGSVLIDDFSLVSSSRVILNDYNDGSSPDVLGRNWGIMPSPIVISTSFSKDSYEGKYALKVDYDSINSTWSWAGIWNFFTPIATGTYDLSFADNLSLYLKGKGRMKIELKYYDTNNNLQTSSVYLNYDSSSYKKYEIALSSFSSLDKSKVNQLNFVWENSSGTVLIDKIEFFSNSPDKTVKTLEEFDDSLTVLPWTMYYDKNNSAEVSKITGRTKDAVRIDYNFVDGNWFAYIREWGLNFYKYDGISFYIKGEGEENNLEVKIQDFDGTTYIRKFFSITNISDFKKIFIPFNEFFLFSTDENSDKNLNLKSIKTLWFTVSAKNGGKGKVIIDEVSLENERVLGSNGSVFKNFSVKNPVFSPDGDGYKDSIEFSFTLDSRAEIEFEVFNLRGERVDKLSSNYNSGLNNFKYSPNNLKNGIYFWYLKGKTETQEEVKKNIFAVEK